MSNINDDKDPFEIVVGDGLGVERPDDLKTAAANPIKRQPFVKAPIIDPNADPGALTPEQVIAISQLVEKTTRDTIASAKFDPKMPGQVIPKSAVPIVDFSKLSVDQVYDLSIPIEAKPFFSADVLKITLKDSNYEARWVNKNPQNLGDKIAKGFTYITELDLLSADAIQTAKDSSGHFCFHDVVAMKIDKATYMQALRYAHMRAINATDQSNAVKRAARQAQEFLQKSDVIDNDPKSKTYNPNPNPEYNPNDYNSYARNKKVEFYDPGVEV